MGRLEFIGREERTPEKIALFSQLNPLRKFSVSLLKHQELLHLWCSASFLAPFEIYVGSQRKNSTRGHAFFPSISSFTVSLSTLCIMRKEGRRKRTDSYPLHKLTLEVQPLALCWHYTVARTATRLQKENSKDFVVFSKPKKHRLWQPWGLSLYLPTEHAVNRCFSCPRLSTCWI